jgi:pyridoxamine 5'-phosphate oxidase
VGLLFIMRTVAYRFPAELSSILHIVWGELEDAVKDRTHGFHTGSLATLDEGGDPDNRVCTLRRVERDGRLLMTHADIRAPKAMQVLARMRGQSRMPAAWVFYDAGRRLQVRAKGTMHVEQVTRLVDEQWERTSVVSRRCYVAPHAPGTVTSELDVNIEPALRDRRPEMEETLAGRANFCVLVTRVDELDAMELAADGHRRAGFVWADGEVRGEWRAP